MMWKGVFDESIPLTTLPSQGNPSSESGRHFANCIHAEIQTLIPPTDRPKDIAALERPGSGALGPSALGNNISKQSTSNGGPYPAGQGRTKLRIPNRGERYPVEVKSIGLPPVGHRPVSIADAKLFDGGHSGVQYSTLTAVKGRPGGPPPL